MSDPKPMTVRELRHLLSGLDDDELIFVDGYEGGFDRPRLMTGRVKTLEPWTASSSYCGVWGEARLPVEGVPVWVLSRTPEWADD